MANLFQTVMLIDDDEATNFWHKRIIKKINPHVDFIVYDSSTTAIEFMQSNDFTPPDLILLDINMPGPNGREVLDKLPQGSLNNIPVIIVSTFIDDAKRSRFSEFSSAVAFAEKPLTTQKLEEIFENFG